MIAVQNLNQILPLQSTKAEEEWVQHKEPPGT